MNKDEIVDALVDTVICGNKIENNETYSKMLARVTIKDIRNYLGDRDINLPGVNFFGISKVTARDKNRRSLTKLEIFKFIKNTF